MTYHIITQLLTSQENSRPRQIRRLTQPSQRNPTLHIRLLLRIRQIGIIQLRTNRSGQERIAPDPVFTQCNCARLHQTQDTGLGGGVVCLFAAADERGDRADADDGAAGWGLGEGHLSGGGLCGEECAGEVGGNGVVEEGGFESGIAC